MCSAAPEQVEVHVRAKQEKLTRQQYGQCSPSRATSTLPSDPHKPRGHYGPRELGSEWR